MPYIVLILATIIALRLLYRTGLLEFPPWPGRSPLQGQDVEGLMEEDEFWGLIAEARRQASGNYNDQVEALTELLKGHGLEDIIAFERAFVALDNRANDWRFWEAAYALNGGCSDDCFIDFRAWWIGHGKNKFYWSVRFPRLLFFFAVKDMLQPYEGLQYCARDAYRELAQKDMPDNVAELRDTAGKPFNEGLAMLKYPELVLLAW